MPSLTSIPRANSQKVRVVSRKQAVLHKLKFWNRDPSAVFNLIGNDGGTTRMYVIAEKGMDLQEILLATGYAKESKKCEFGTWIEQIEYDGVVVQDEFDKDGKGKGGGQVKQNGELPMNPDGSWAAAHNLKLEGKNNEYEFVYDPYTEDLPGGCSGDAKADYSKYGRKLIMWVDPNELLTQEKVQQKEQEERANRKDEFVYIPQNLVTVTYWSVGRELEARAKNEKQEEVVEQKGEKVIEIEPVKLESPEFTIPIKEVEISDIKTPEIRLEKMEIQEQRTPPIREKPVSYSAQEFSEEENPIIRCIMDPAFRKTYGALYGFIDGEEYKAGELSIKPFEYSEPKKAPKLRKEGKKRGRSEQELDYPKQKKPKMKRGGKTKIEMPKNPKTQKTKTKREKPKEKESEIPKYRGERRGKTAKDKDPKEKKSKKNRKRKPPKELPKQRGRKLKDFRIQEFKPREFRRVEQFLAKQLKISKIKIQKFKLFIIKLQKELKQEVKLIIIKVKEFFKLKENLQKLKNELEKSWVLNYSKMKLQKLITRMEYKVEILKREIKVLVRRIKSRIVRFTSKDLRLDAKVEALRRVARILLLLLLAKWFKD